MHLCLFEDLVHTGICAIVKVPEVVFFMCDYGEFISSRPLARKNSWIIDHHVGRSQQLFANPIHIPPSGKQGILVLFYRYTVRLDETQLHSARDVKKDVVGQRTTFLDDESVDNLPSGCSQDRWKRLEFNTLLFLRRIQIWNSERIFVGSHSRRWKHESAAYVFCLNNNEI